MITFDELIEAHSGPNERVAYSIGSCWWTHDIQSDCKSGPPIDVYDGDRFVGKNPGIPLDPELKPMYEAPTLAFLRAAEEQPEHYGTGGLDVFMFAHHQNCGGRCFRTWAEAQAAWEQAGSPNLREVR